MAASIRIRRRAARPSPMRVLRVGAAARTGAAPRVSFPGFAFPRPEGRARRLAALLGAVAVHAVLLGALVLANWLSPPEEKEKPIPVALLPPPPPPPPRPEPRVERAPEPAPVAAPRPAPEPIKEPAPAPAPAPKALAERRSVNFAPQAQAIRPQVVNPSVVAKAAPAIPAPKLDRNLVSSVTAPREISSAPLAVESVQAAPSPVAATPSRVDLGAAGAPALRGPIEPNAPVGASVGPRQIVASGKTVGTGRATTGDDGSSVREGVLSSRDVLGSPDGPRLANVNTRVGQSHLKGPGGTGTVLGGGDPDCDSRPEVRAYMDTIKDRTLARWATSGTAPAGRVRAKLRFQLDVGGSASRVEMVSADDPAVGSSVVEALRAASPFPPMSDRVRCLADSQLTATFTLETTSTAVAN
jgi:hypothetical protein